MALIGIITAHTEFLRYINFPSLASIFLFYWNPNIYPTPEFNFIFWALIAEMQFYFVIPWLLWLYKLISNKLSLISKLAGKLLPVILFIALLSYIYLFEFVTGLYEFIIIIQSYSFGLQFLHVFLIGVGLFLVLDEFQNILPKLRKVHFFSPIVLLIAIFLPAYMQYELVINSNLRRTPVILIGLIVSLYIVLVEAKTNSQKPIRNEITIKSVIKNPFLVLEFLGLISYGVYIWHTYVNGAVWAELPDSWLPYKLFLTVSITLILSTFTYYYIELRQFQKK